MTSIRQTSGWRGCVDARATCAQKRACKWSAASERLAQKLRACDGLREKKKEERKKKGKGPANRRQFEPLNRDDVEKNSDRIASFIKVSVVGRLGKYAVEIVRGGGVSILNLCLPSISGYRFGKRKVSYYHEEFIRVHLENLVSFFSSSILTELTGLRTG